MWCEADQVKSRDGLLRFRQILLAAVGLLAAGTSPTAPCPCTVDVTPPRPCI